MFGLWVCAVLISSTSQVVLAEEGFDFQSSFDIQYASSVLDQKVNPAQTLDIYKPIADTLSPVILYIHGGGWAFGDKKQVNLKPNYFTLQGFAFVSMNYRLRWEYKVYDQLIDVASALRWINQHGAEHGLDRSRVVLMGHASGAHLASLVMTDHRYLQGESVPVNIVKAVIAIDSVSYDIPRLMNELGSFVERRQHELVFAGSEQVWRAASPITHVASSISIPPFALLYNPENEASILQAKGFAKELTAAKVAVVMIPGQKDQTDELLGAGNVTTGALMAFIRSQL